MIVETIGLPGAGKTTCERSLYTKLKERGCHILLPEQDVQNRYVRDHVYTRHALNYRYHHLKVVRAIASLKYRAHVGRSHLCDRCMTGTLLGAWTRTARRACWWLSEDMLLFSYYLNEILPSSGEGTVYLASEGLAHHSATVKVFAGDPFAALSDRWLHRHACTCMVIVHVQVPPSTAAQRIWERGLPRSWPRRIRRSRLHVQQVLSRFADAVEESIQRFQQAGARIVNVDNSSNMATLDVRVADVAASLSDAG